MAVSDAHVFPGFLTPLLTQLPFQSHRLLFSHASAEIRGKKTLERKLASTVYQTHNHQVTSLTRSPPSHPSQSKTRSFGKELNVKCLLLSVPSLEARHKYCQQ